MDKVYIVANEQQEREVLEKFEREGLVWIYDEKPTEWMPSSGPLAEFPYVLFNRNKISWGFLGNFSDEEVVFDGRKEEHMSEKYVVSQVFMNELNEWKAGLKIEGQYHVDDRDLFDMPVIIDDWWLNINTSALEQNNRLIAIIRWVNGEDVFEVKPKKWVVRSLETDEDGDCHYVNLDNFKNLKSVSTLYGLGFATKFDTKEDAEGWANSHQEVVEVVDV